jgi:hypothetical protein
MFDCFVDGKAKTFQLLGSESLATIIDNVNKDLASGGKFIASLRVNGEELENDLSGMNRNLEGIHSIEILSDTPHCLAGRILDEGGNYIDGLMDFLGRVAGSYNSGSENAASYFAEAVQGLQWFVQMTDFIECTLAIDFNVLKYNGKTVSEHVNGLNTILLELADAQQAGDPVIIADILEYDLVPNLAEWKNIFTLFAGEMKRGSA